MQGREPLVSLDYFLPLFDHADDRRTGLALWLGTDQRKNFLQPLYLLLGLSMVFLEGSPRIVVLGGSLPFLAERSGSSFSAK